MGRSLYTGRIYQGFERVIKGCASPERAGPARDWQGIFGPSRDQCGFAGPGLREIIWCAAWNFSFGGCCTEGRASPARDWHGIPGPARDHGCGFFSDVIPGMTPQGPGASHFPPVIFLYVGSMSGP